MRTIRYLFFAVALITAMACKEQIKYPLTKKTNISDNYFGVRVADPYRWLENDTSKETGAWVKAENAVTKAYLSKIPFRDKIQERLTKIWNYPKYGIPFWKGTKYFFFKNDGLQNQAILYMQKGLEGNPEVLLDPNQFSSDGTISLGSMDVSRNGKYLAYSISRSGSDWNEICIMDIESGKHLTDTIKWVKFSGIVWEGEGFYYSRYNEPKPGMELTSSNEFHKVYFHRLFLSQKQDELIYENPKEAKRNYVTSVTEDEQFLLLYESETTDGVALYYKDLKKKNVPFKQLAQGFEYEYGVVDNLEDRFLVVTNYQAPKRKLILMDPRKPEPVNWKTVLPEKEEVLESVELAGGRIIARYMQKVISRVFVYDLDGKLIHELTLPGPGTIGGFSGKRDNEIAFYSFTSFTYPSTVFKYDVSENRSDVYTQPDIDFNPDDYIVKQVFYKSKDQTSIPMFIVYKKGTELNGKNPTLLYGYGGFNVSLTPDFRISRLIFLENGGIYAMANLRGGGEFGEEWHKAGIKEKKQNVFDDFIAAAEYLISEKYTCPGKLAILGGSNGGLLVGAAMIQRPDLFWIAIPQVGVMDMLRYHKFTIGRAWAGDYGTSETREGFDYLFKYSPLHNLKKGVHYPATLAFTADHDDRVVPAHTFKFMATLQECQGGDNPVLVRIDTKAGHGGGKPTSKLIDEVTDLWSFIFYNLGMEPK